LRTKLEEKRAFRVQLAVRTNISINFYEGAWLDPAPPPLFNNKASRLLSAPLFATLQQPIMTLSRKCNNIISRSIFEQFAG